MSQLVPQLQALKPNERIIIEKEGDFIHFKYQRDRSLGSGVIRDKPGQVRFSAELSKLKASLTPIDFHLATIIHNARLELDRMMSSETNKGIDL